MKLRERGQALTELALVMPLLLMLGAGGTDLAREEPLCLVAEGLPGDSLVLPPGAREEDCRWRLLVDPIDGTRGLMYQKRSAWILTGVAPNRLLPRGLPWHSRCYANVTAGHPGVSQFLES